MRPLRKKSALALALSTISMAVLSSSASAAGGFDDWSCKPSAAHPSPVVMLHGLGGNGPGNMGAMGLRLASAGYCAYELTYGKPISFIPVGGLVDVRKSAREVQAFIERVRTKTRAAKVDILGHSEGGLLSLYLPKFGGIADEIDRVVALAPGTHGTEFFGLLTFATTPDLQRLVTQVVTTVGCVACSQLAPWSDVIRSLNTGPIAQPGVSYTVIASRTDTLVTPHGSATTSETAFVDEPGVTNRYVQDLCASSKVGHIGLAYDTGVQRMVLNAFDPSAAAPVACDRTGLPF